jgi:hypothetical protein
MARRRTSYYNRWVTSSLLDQAVARNRPLLLDDADDVADAAAVLAAGGVIAQGFGNFYALTSGPTPPPCPGSTCSRAVPPTRSAVW